LAPVADAVVDEGSLLTIQLNASDPDLPANALTFSLEPGAPEGVQIDPTSGLLTWTPNESQGPGSYTITVRVTDNASPQVSDTKTFKVTVNEVNNPPVMDFIQAQT